MIKLNLLLPLLGFVSLFTLFVPRDTMKTSAETIPQTIKAPQTSERKIQIVFALDATGSMAGLIDAAKDKIWSIASSISQSDQPPVLEIGMLFYRDKGDEFITKRIALSDSIDVVYKELMAIRAAGGGDAPESVNQALYEAVEMFNWDPSPLVYKTVFLVGDQPPHMDYSDDVKYPQTCILAKGKNIFLNTIQMGKDPKTKKVWYEIANCAMGSYVMVDMNVNDIKINTPYDDEIARLNNRYESMNIYYGDKTMRSKGNDEKALAEVVVTGSSNNVKAQRAEYKLKKSVSVKSVSNNLYNDLLNNTITLDKIKEDELPDELRKMKPDERKVYVNSKIQERKALQDSLFNNIKLRNDYISKEMAKRSGDKKSFNEIIYDNIKAQAKTKDIILTGNARF
jgi:hypothetical protein